MATVQYTTAQLAEQALAAAAALGGSSTAVSWPHRSSASCRVLGGKTCPHSECMGPDCSSQEEDDEESASEADSDYSDSDEGSDLVDEHFLDPDSPDGIAVTAVGRAENLSPLAFEQVARLDRAILAHANRYAEHCWERTYTLEAYRGANLLSIHQVVISDEELDAYLETHGKRPQDEAAYPAHEIRQRLQNADAQLVEQRMREAGVPTPRPGPPLLGRTTGTPRTETAPTSSATASGTSSFSPQRRNSRPTTAAGRTPTQRRPPPPSNARDGPFSLPESARQELYELYQYAPDGSGARGEGDPAAADALSSGLRRVELELVVSTGSGSEEVQEEAEDELEASEGQADHSEARGAGEECEAEAEAALRGFERESDEAQRRRGVRGGNIGR